MRKSSWKKQDKKETKLTFQKSRKKEYPSMKKNAWFCQILRVKGKTFSKEKSKTWEEFFWENGWKKSKSGTDIFSEEMLKKRKERRKEGSGDETTLIGVCAHTTPFFTTHAIWFFTKISEGPNQVFLMVGKSQCITTGVLTTPSLCCILQIIFHCFWTLWIQRTCRGITHGNVLNLWHHDSFFSAHEQDHVQNDQLDSSNYGLVSSVVFIWLLFVYVSFSVLFHQSHTSSSLFNPLLIFFQWINIHSKTLQGCIHLVPVIWQILPFSIVGLPGHVHNKFEPCVVVAHVLFVDDESRGDSIFQFACFLFQAVELSFTNFFF